MKSQKFITEEEFKSEFKVYPQKDDVLMTRIGDVGTPNVVKNNEKVAFYVSLALLKPFDIDSYFLYSSIQSFEFQKNLHARTLTTAIPQKINKEEIGKIKFLMPKGNLEQGHIGKFFKKIDDNITFQKQKIVLLEKQKKYLLQKMFI
ncbi:restriction endonuclease subunit S [Bombilactobacillus thymidiniphilus]|uniref:Restriction endonuclease subunit S n=1 Tax=Bombilactobacillus thymidiniphilus TaxID=2923363 RepID=A0ABY4PEV6_9LACO|nr:restriction endonuclease subunit S [Bombilactobacillus thymidiniphilus]UQS84122.1 restriction endonuclease subunit S [Bombilactobacillus thymidiniphilus]